MSEYGQVQNVYARLLGTSLEAAAALGATSITVVDAAVFANGGNALRLNDTTHTFTTADPDTGIISGLVPSLATAADEDDEVYLWDSAADAGFTEYVAKVALEPDNDNDDPVEAYVDHTLIPFLPEGIRELAGETVRLERIGQTGYRVADILRQTPVMDGTLIDPATLPSNPSDGNPPATSPAPTVTGGIGALHVRWEAVVNADIVDYEVHVSPTSGFTPDASTLSVTTKATSHAIRELVTAVGDPATTDLHYNTPYYVKLIAKDADGSAAVSAEASGQIVPVFTGDIAVNQAWVGTMVVDNLLGGTLDANVTVSGTIKTSDSGARVELSNAGLTAYDADDTASVVIPSDISVDNPATFRGTVTALGLTVEDNLSIRGASNELSQGADLTLATGISNPGTKPTATAQWAGLLLHDTGGTWTGLSDTFDPNGIVGLTWSGTEWWVGYADGSTARILRFDTTGEYLGLAGDSVGTGWTVIGATRIGTTNYFLAKSGASYQLYRRADGSGVTQIHGYSEFNPDDDPFLSVDGLGNIVVVEWKDNQYRVNTRDPVTLTSGTVFLTDTEAATAPGPGGYYRGSADFGADRHVFARSHGGAFLRVFNTAGAYQADEIWKSPNESWGLAFDGTNFWTISRTGFMTKYEGGGNKWTTESSTWWIAYTWYDGNVTGGTHETAMSPKASITMTKRARLSLSAPDLPGAGGTDDPDGTRWYLGRGSTSPASTAMWLNATETDTGTAVTSATFAGTNPPTVNGFTSSSPSEIVSDTTDGTGPLIQIKGDGSYRFAGTNLDDTGWVAFDSGTGEAPFATAVENHCEYRRIGKLVQIRLQKNSTASRDVSGSSSGNFANVNVTAIGAVPAAILPSQTIEFPCRLDDAPTTGALTTGGTIQWTGGHPRVYGSGSTFNATITYFIG